MSSPSFPFLSLPRELREQVYDLAFKVEPSSRLYDPGTRYTKATAPLLYVHETITNELQPRLYEDHAIVLPIQKPVIFLNEGKPVAPRLKKLPRMMTRRTKKIIVEVPHPKYVRDTYYVKDIVTMSDDEDEDKEGDGDNNSAEGIREDIDECSQKDTEEDDWEDTDDSESSEESDFEGDENLGIASTTKLTRELLSLKPQLPSTKTIKVIQWSSHSDYTRREIENWQSQLSRLTEQWDGIKVEFQLNIIEWDEGFSGACYDWAQLWHRTFQDSPKIRFSVVELAWEDLYKGSYLGRELDPTGPNNPDINTMSLEERTSTLYTGARVQCRPLFIKVWPFA
ncbi:hypothetical protein EDB81DRAFT_809375 [Dactylonectria macrodidyma]|uniref:Uncharacterized protein n=1 Tax=Dactylonectria macrodidyma TaxID=307937 RepID=A0A9P9DVW5_9HYPO|nr:hypothetical protein EDB81DRAFT_809375 [Dactylonectria macrodidyma]